MTSMIGNISNFFYNNSLTACVTLALGTVVAIAVKSFFEKTAPATVPVMEFRRTKDYEGRPYFVIEALPGGSLANGSFAKPYQDKGLEVITINDRYRAELELSAEFNGIGIFIQKHNSDDPDHSLGRELGNNIYETYRKIQEVGLRKLTNQSIQDLKGLKGEVNECPTVYPQFGQLDELLKEVEATPHPFWKWFGY